MDKCPIIVDTVDGDSLLGMRLKPDCDVVQGMFASYMKIGSMDDGMFLFRPDEKISYLANEHVKFIRKATNRDLKRFLKEE